MHSIKKVEESEEEAKVLVEKAEAKAKKLVEDANSKRMQTLIEVASKIKSERTKRVEEKTKELEEMLKKNLSAAQQKAEKIRNAKISQRVLDGVANKALDLIGA